jgi:hypothetical protein
MSKTPKRPKDANQLAKSIVNLATGEVEEQELSDEDIPVTVSQARKGGQKGGKARAESLTPEQRSEIARMAATARWKKSS